QRQIRGRANPAQYFQLSVKSKAAANGAREWPTPPATSQEHTRSHSEGCFPSTTDERCGACLPPTKSGWQSPSAALWPVPAEDLRRLRMQSRARILLRQI